MMYERQYVAATDGNLSVRLEDGSILATPTGLCKGMMSPDDLVIVDLDGQRKSGSRNVSSEIAFFFQCYRHRPDLHSFPTRRSSDLITLTRVSCKAQTTCPEQTPRPRFRRSVQGAVGQRTALLGRRMP